MADTGAQPQVETNAMELCFIVDVVLTL